jgi:hypothetical protein
MRRNISGIIFVIAMLVAAIAIYAFWVWVLQPLGLVPHWSSRQVEILDRIVFCSNSALVAIACIIEAVECWIHKDLKGALFSLLATAGSVVLGAGCYLCIGRFGAGALAFGIPMLLAIVLQFFRLFEKGI